MPSPWLSALPQWNIPSHAQNARQHPPPAPASSTYSPAPTARSAALRPASGIFGRFTTPRLGSRPLEAPDVPPVPIQFQFQHQPSPTTPWPPHGTHHQNDHLYEAGPGQRSHGTGSVVDDMNVPSPLFGAAAGTTGTHHRPGLQPPAPIHSNAANAAGDLPIFFSPSEIGDAPVANPSHTQDQEPNSNDRQRRRRRHRRHHHGHHTHTRTTRKPSSSSRTLRPTLRDPAIRVKILHTVIAGALFLLTLIVFLALNANPATPVFSQPFRVVNSLLIVFFAVIFVHSAILLGVMVSRHRRRLRRVARKNKLADGSVSGSGDFGRGVGVGVGSGLGGGNGGGNGRRAQYFDDPEIGLPPPGEPIRVVLARDEDIGVNDDLVAEDEQVADGIRPDAELNAEDHASEHAPAGPASGSSRRAQMTPKLPPPVYGVWRGSVRADPNLLHWQRVERAGVAGSESEEGVELAHGRPPPSYVTQERRAGETGSAGGGAGLQMLPATRYVI